MSQFDTQYWVKTLNIESKLSISSQNSQYPVKTLNIQSKLSISSQNSQYRVKTLNIESKLSISSQNSQYRVKTLNIESKLDIESFGSNIFQLLGITGRILVPPVTQLLGQNDSIFFRKTTFVWGCCRLFVWQSISGFSFRCCGRTLQGIAADDWPCWLIRWFLAPIIVCSIFQGKLSLCLEVCPPSRKWWGCVLHLPPTFVKHPAMRAHGKASNIYVLIYLIKYLKEKN